MAAKLRARAVKRVGRKEWAEMLRMQNMQLEAIQVRRRDLQEALLAVQAEEREATDRAGELRTLAFPKEVVEMLQLEEERLRLPAARLRGALSDARLSRTTTASGKRGKTANHSARTIARKR